MTSIPSDVTGNATEQNLLVPLMNRESWWQSVEGPYFYIDADVSRNWPCQADMTLCKFGVTTKLPEARRRENEQDLRRKWGIDAQLEVVFVATGHITDAEKEIADYTLPWLPDRFQKNAEWRHCSPRELARIATLIAEDRQQ